MPRTVLENVLRRPGVARVWLPRWLSDREGVADDLVAAVDAAREVKASELETPEEPEVNDTDLHGVALAVVDEPAEVDPEPQLVAGAAFAALPDSYSGWRPTARAPELAEPTPASTPVEPEAPRQDDVELVFTA